jgi:hypothetical protein
LHQHPYFVNIEYELGNNFAKKLNLGLRYLFVHDPISWGCEDNGFTSSGPISGYLMGKWKLTKIVSPKSVKIDNQIGYIETIEIGNDNINDFEIFL